MNLQVMIASWVIVFFIQALRVIFSTMFGFIYDQVFEGPINAWLVVSNLLVVGALLAPGILARKPSARSMAAFASLTALARVALSVNDQMIRYWGALIVIAAGGSYLALWLSRKRPQIWQPILWALILEIILRIVGDTFDISLQNASLIPVALWSVLTIGISLWLTKNEQEPEHPRRGLSWVGGLSLGAFFFLETSILSLPNGIARWSNTSYPWIAVLFITITFLPLLPHIGDFIRDRLAQTGGGITVVVLLTGGLLLGYFMSGAAAAVALLLGQAAAVFALVLLLGDNAIPERSPGWPLAMGGLLLLLLDFLNAFAFTYPYTLPQMKGMGWAVYFAACILLAWGFLWKRQDSEQRLRSRRVSGWSWVSLVLAVVIVGVSVWPQAKKPLPEERLRLATYNIHYGYDDDWHTTLEDIARTIEAEDVDVIALQEVDTGRMTSYCADNAYFLARRLGMNVVYLPTVEHLTGIALLYKGPQVPESSTLVASLQEATGVVHAALSWNGKDLHSYGIWLGLSDEDTMRQIEQALAFIGDRSPTSFGGDFNARPDEPEIALIRDAGFADPFALLGIDPAPFTSPAIEPDSRIDYVWVRGLLPVKAWVSDSLASDHRMVVIEVAQP
ncbi:MAG: endonuclease/exonuclease/phosphatase family protein [Anaerolineales bacterium]|nr:endonuclease/exonuclease/phosphatase family protein [Anaerolineales bacterium]